MLTEYSHSGDRTQRFCSGSRPAGLGKTQDFWDITKRMQIVDDCRLRWIQWDRRDGDGRVAEETKGPHIH